MIGQPFTEANLTYAYNRVTRHRGTVKVVADCLRRGDLEALHKERRGLVWEVGRSMGWFDGLPIEEAPFVWARFAALVERKRRELKIPKKAA